MGNVSQSVLPKWRRSRFYSSRAIRKSHRWDAKPLRVSWH